MQVTITYTEGEIIHNDENPYCEDESCPCQEAKRKAIAFAEEARKAAALAASIKRDMRRQHQ